MVNDKMPLRKLELDWLQWPCTEDRTKKWGIVILRNRRFPISIKVDQTDLNAFDFCKK